MHRRSNSKSRKSCQFDLRLSHPLDSNRPTLSQADETSGQESSDLNLDWLTPRRPGVSPL
jgi:hypothetical protein